MVTAILPLSHQLKLLQSAQKFIFRSKLKSSLNTDGETEAKNTCNHTQSDLEDQGKCENNQVDELDISFTALAMCIRYNLSMKEREAIHSEILNFVNKVISN